MKARHQPHSCTLKNPTEADLLSGKVLTAEEDAQSILRRAQLRSHLALEVLPLPI